MFTVPSVFRARSWLGLVWLLVFTLASFAVQPLTSAAQTNELAVDRIDAFVRNQVQRHGIPGLALALVDGDQIIHLGGYGKADQTGRAITPQTPFVLASVSKPITALAIMQLVEAGKVELDAPVQRYLPEFRVADVIASQQITVRHLLNHTSGIPEQGCRSRAGAKTLEAFVAELQTVELDAPVGARHFYCSGNYNILGRIIEVVAGQSYAGYLQQHIFTPLEMRHSFTTEEDARRDGLAQGYRWFFGLPLPMDFPYDVPQAPSGFLIASAEDMGHFLIAQLNGGRFGSTRILSPEGIAAMQAPGVAIGAGTATYGLGWRSEVLGEAPVIAHAGNHPNAHTLIFIEPETRRGAVLLMNAQNVLLAHGGAFREIEEGVARFLAGQEPAPPSALTLPQLYLIVDLVLGVFLLLALWPLLRMRQQYEVGHLRLWRVGLRIAWEFVLPLTLLIGARLLLHALGAQSWAEGLLLFPDFGVWLWVFSLLILVTGLIRLVIFLGIRWRNDRLVHFLVFTLILTALVYLPIISGGTIQGPIVIALMWAPGIAALLTQWITTRSLRGLGWRWGQSGYQLLSFLLPLGVCLVVYGFVWGAGLVPLTTARIAEAVEIVAALTGQRLSLPLALLVAQVMVFPLNLFTALGEEIGWRGLLTPELAKRYSFTKTALLSGLIWALFHYPAILFADYHSSAPLWYGLTMFTFMALGVSFVLTWFRLKSGSLWTAVIFHASHNLFVQAIFDPMTLDNGWTPYFVTEFGVGLAIAYGLLAIVFWHRRGEGTRVAALVRTTATPIHAHD